MARRGFFAELQRQARIAQREAERQRREAIKRQNAAIRQAEQARKAEERAKLQAARAADAERKRLEKKPRQPMWRRDKRRSRNSMRYSLGPTRRSTVFLLPRSMLMISSISVR
jgi:hypothetical protein